MDMEKLYRDYFLDVYKYILAVSRDPLAALKSKLRNRNLPAVREDAVCEGFPGIVFLQAVRGSYFLIDTGQPPW